MNVPGLEVQSTGVQHRSQDFDANALPGVELTVLLSVDSFANGNTSTFPMQ